MRYLANVRRAVAKHGGRVEPDGNGGYDLLAPDGFRWRVAEVWCQPLPLGEAETKEERQEMLETALNAVKDGIEPFAEERA